MGESSPANVSTPTGAVFLSYASEDAVAAQRLAEALRSAGMEVWFDREELRGGDAWDQKIRQQIRDCRLFVPIISAHTEARLEGYFRREWKLAVDRTENMASEVAFLLPVVIDDTPNASAHVPERFRDVQWSRLPGAGASSTFVSRVAALLGGEPPAPVVGRTQPAFSAPPATHSARRARWPLIGAAAAIAISVAAWLSWHLSTHPSGQSAGPAAQPKVVERSIAVLPFVDLSEKHDQEYFADGMAEEILDVLVKVPDLKVIGRTSSFQFKGKAEDLRKIGAALGASYVVEGSVRRAQDRLRVTAQLIDTRDGAHLWSNTFDTSATNVLDVQQAIATGISRSLKVTLVEGVGESRAVGDAAAYDLYLRGLHALGTASTDSCLEAIELFNQLLRSNPRSSRVLISLAWAHECVGYEDYRRSDAGMSQAQVFAARALQVDPKAADAHLVLASVAILQDYDWGLAGREIATAFKLRPPTARGYTIAARLAMATGDFAGAVQHLHFASNLDPLDPYVYDQLGDAYSRAGQYRQAEDMYRRCIQIAPDFDIEHFFVANALLLQHHYDEALAELEREPDEGTAHAGRALVFHALGRHSESDSELQSFLSYLETSQIPWYSEVARIHAFRGERDRAMEFLDKAYQKRDVDLYFIKGDPLLKNLESDPRYKAFLRKMNLPE